MAGSEFLCVREATLLRKQIRQAFQECCHKACGQNCQDYYPIFVDIFLALTTAQPKNIDIALAITLVRTS